MTTPLDAGGGPAAALLAAHNELERRGGPDAMGHWMRVNCLIHPNDDIFAFFAGRAIGGPKLAPRISPGKTWSGLAGGMAAAAAASAVFSVWSAAPLSSLCFWGAATAVVAQAGDLLESAAKRRFGVKDSGTLIPGHGGILDRVDGLVAALLLVAIARLLGGGSVPW